MNRTLLSIIVAGVSSVAASANASDGTINFNGRLVDQTCQIEVNGASTDPATVQLPTISSGLLAKAGDVAGQTGFVIGLRGCEGQATAAAVFFENGSTVDLASGNLNNTTSGGAERVQLQLLDADGRAINVGKDTQLASPSRVTLNGGAADLPYAVQYFATGAATPGVVTSSVTFAIDYQ